MDGLLKIVKKWKQAEGPSTKGHTTNVRYSLTVDNRESLKE